MKKDFLKLFGWSFYDFANTIFSAIVLTAYFPLYFTELTGKNWTLGVATTASMILSGLVVPYLGVVSDRTGRTKYYLELTTLACIVCLIPLALIQNSILLLIFFLISCFFYHSSLVFYNSLLPAASSKDHQGFASGLGTGLGYAGVLLALPLAHHFDTHFGRPSVFLVAAALFFLFSLPLFFFVPERRVPNPKPFHTRLYGEEWRKVFRLVASLPKHPALLLFFLGNFLVLDALNSTIFWFLVYAREVFSQTQGILIKLMMAVNASAFIFGILTGILTDKAGSMKTLVFSSLVLALTLAGLVFAVNFQAFAVLTCLGGSLAIAGIWTAGRKALVEFAPTEKLGQYFGLYGLTTKISVLGSTIFSILADTIGFEIALLSLAVPAALGTFLLFLSGRRIKTFRPHELRS